MTEPTPDETFKQKFIDLVNDMTAPVTERFTETEKVFFKTLTAEQQANFIRLKFEETIAKADSSAKETSPLDPSHKWMARLGTLIGKPEKYNGARDILVFDSFCRAITDFYLAANVPDSEMRRTFGSHLKDAAATWFRYYADAGKGRMDNWMLQDVLTELKS